MRVNFAQLTQRAGNFLVGRQPEDNFKWESLKGKKVLGGRAGGMPQMVFEYILKKHGMDPKTDLSIDQSINFRLTAAAFTSDDADYTVEFEPLQPLWRAREAGMWWLLLEQNPDMYLTLLTVPGRVTLNRTRKSFRSLPMPSKRAWTT